MVVERGLILLLLQDSHTSRMQLLQRMLTLVALTRMPMLVRTIQLELKHNSSNHSSHSRVADQVDATAAVVTAAAPEVH